MLEDGKHKEIIDSETWNIVREKRDRTVIEPESSVPYKRVHLQD